MCETTTKHLGPRKLRIRIKHVDVLIYSERAQKSGYGIDGIVRRVFPETNRPTNPRVAGTNVNSWNLCVAFQIVYAGTFAGGTDNKPRNTGFGTGMNKHESLNGLKLRPPELTH